MIQRGTSKLASPEDRTKMEELKKEIEQLKHQELNLDEQIKNYQILLKQMIEEPNKQKFAFLTYNDIRNIPSMDSQTLIAIKAPVGTRLEVPDPDEVLFYNCNKRVIILKGNN